MMQIPFFLAGVLAGAAASAIRAARLKATTRRLATLLDERTAEVAEANQRLDELATTDELTNISNRRRFDDFLQQEWNRTLRAGAPIALLMLDVDFFKLFNDTYGHQTGDLCLQRVAGILRAAVSRPGDLPTRYGGEEFAVILGSTGREAAVRLADAIRRDVEDLKIPHEASPVSPFVTVSIGVGVANPADDGGTPELLTFAADEALYRAKDRGRNVVVPAWTQAVELRS